ncbi:MAG: hypothetical protein A2Y15_08065 [Clostridiales bacterium GWF2_36_10]|nr:MAG: hypothetical protein A2Y15_08065 [Clostridiales bacterium GWF2_36_10]HAN21841.1 hypothetical protein [Clostridiales bacterium]
MKNRILILILSAIFIILLAGCNGDTTSNSITSSNVDTSVGTSVDMSVDTSSSDETSGDSSLGSDSSSDEYTEKTNFFTYEDFWSDFPEFHGQWRITEYCTSARYVEDNWNYIIENCPEEVLEFTEEGIEFLNNFYSQDSEMSSFLDLYSKSEICAYSGYLEYDKVPLSGSSEKIYEYFTLSIDDENLELNDPDNFYCFYLCTFENDKLFIGIDGVFFTAERLESVHTN